MLDVALLAIPKRVLITSLIDDRYKYNQGFNGFYKANNLKQHVKDEWNETELQQLVLILCA